MDYTKLTQDIAGWMRERLSEANAAGFVVGLSGGIDSAVVAALCKQTVADQVLALWLPCYSMDEDRVFAQITAEALHLELMTIDLSPVYDAFLEALPEGSHLARANLKPRLRMSTLYYVANTRNYLVAGTGNKDETMVGFFTKYGDGGVDLKPLGELYKRDVRELARLLDIPRPVIDRAPSPGLWPGQTDEGEMGVTYAEIDAVLEAWDTGQQPDLPPDRLTRIGNMVARTAHKRVLPPSFPVKRTP